MKRATRGRFEQVRPDERGWYVATPSDLNTNRRLLMRKAVIGLGILGTIAIGTSGAALAQTCPPGQTLQGTICRAAPPSVGVAPPNYNDTRATGTQAPIGVAPPKYSDTRAIGPQAPIGVAPPNLSGSSAAPTR